MSSPQRDPKRGPKLTVIGAGSMYFGRQAIKGMLDKDILKEGTLALVDTQEPTLKKLMTLAEKAKEHAGAPTTIIGSTDRREVLADSDFVVLSFANDGIGHRKIDTEIAAKHGVRMCSSDTIGPGGIFRTLRESHEVIAVDRDVHELAPDAWLINYINPTSCLGILLMRHGKCRSFALCDGNHEPHRRRGLLKTVGLLNGKPDPELEARADIRISGVNHFTWLTKFDVDGKDYMPKYREHLIEHAADQDETAHSKGRKNGRYLLALYELFGAVPTATGHTKEYVPYWQGYTRNDPDIEPITLFDADERARKREGIYAEIDEYISGAKPMSEFFEKVSNDHATDIIESMWGNLGKPFFINQPNRGAVSNLPDDAFLELRSDVDMDGPRPQPVGELPRGVRGLTEQVLDTHELTVEAAVTCDRTILRRAMLTDPIVNSISDADAIIEDMLEAQRAALPVGWFKA